MFVHPTATDFEEIGNFSDRQKLVEIGVSIFRRSIIESGVLNVDCHAAPLLNNLPLIPIQKDRTPPRGGVRKSCTYEDDAIAPRSSCSSNASSTSSRMRFCAATSAIGRSSANVRRSPFTWHWREGTVTLRPLP